jgi:hypothetical protein
MILSDHVVTDRRPSGGGSCFAGILDLLCECRDFARELQAKHDEGLEPIGFDDQKVVVAEPIVELTKTIAAAFDFDAAIDTEQRHTDVAAEAAARSAGQWYAFSGEARILKRAHDRALGSISFLA